MSQKTIEKIIMRTNVKICNMLNKCKTPKKCTRQDFCENSLNKGHVCRNVHDVYSHHNQPSFGVVGSVASVATIHFLNNLNSSDPKQKKKDDLLIHTNLNQVVDVPSSDLSYIDWSDSTSYSPYIDWSNFGSSDGGYDGDSD
jgi:hypothetical protein